MKLNPLRVFLAVVDTGSQRAAARLLGLTQPAVTKSLQKLENEYGVRLFERSIHGASLTEFGKSFLAHARIIDAELRTCAESMDQLKGLGKGAVSIALSHLPNVLILPKVLTEFRTRWPDVHLRVAASAYPYLLNGLRDGTLDFAIAPAPEVDWPEDLLREPIMRTRLLPIVRTGHPSKDEKYLKDLKEYEWILPTEESATAQALYTAAASEGIAKPRCHITCETLTGMVTAVAESDLIGLIPKELFSCVQCMADISEVPINTALEGADLCLVKRRVGVPSPACASLMDLFAKVTTQLVGRMQ